MIKNNTRFVIAAAGLLAANVILFRMSRETVFWGSHAQNKTARAFSSLAAGLVLFPSAALWLLLYVVSRGRAGWRRSEVLDQASAQSGFLACHLFLGTLWMVDQPTVGPAGLLQTVYSVFAHGYTILPLIGLGLMFASTRTRSKEPALGEERVKVRGGERGGRRSQPD
jgi:hypothetical protein